MLFNKYKDILDDFLHGYGSNPLKIAISTGCWQLGAELGSSSDRSKQFKSQLTPNMDIKNHS